MMRNEGRPKVFRTLAMLCESESLSDAQLKAYQTRLQEYRTYLEAVSRLANCGNVCITEESVMIGDNGLLTGESLNALQHAGAISVYNTLQQNNWEYPVPEEGEVAVIKAHTTVPDEFLDSEKPIRSDWPSVFVSECFVEGEKAKLHGSARPLRSFLPPSIVFRSAADIDDDLPEPEVPASGSLGPETGLEIISIPEGLAIRKAKENDANSYEVTAIDEYYYGRQDGNSSYTDEKAEFRFKCAVCQRMFYSNIKLMHHIMGHVDETLQTLLGFALNQCRICDLSCAHAFALRAHMEKDHGGAAVVETPKADGAVVNEDGITTPAATAAAAATGTQLSATGYSCRICSKEAASDLALAHHLQSTHRQREMPYVCRICLFRSSLYEDLLDHFKKAHNGTNHLLCIYCLRIFTPSDARVLGLTSPLVASPTSTAGLGAGVGQTQVYLQHLRMHQVQHQLRKCPACRLNFTNKSDYQVHRRLDHKAGSSNSAAAAEQQLKEQQQQQAQQVQEVIEQEAERQQQQEAARAANEYLTTQQHHQQQQVEAMDTDDTRPVPHHPEPALTPQQQEKQAREQQLVASLNAAKVAAAAAAAASAVDEAVAQAEEDRVILLNAPEASRRKDLSATQLPREADQLVCLECGDKIASSNHKQYLPCPACVFATCCATAFTRHIHRAHMPASTADSGHKGTPLVRPVRSFDWLPASTDQSVQVPRMEERFACPRCALSGVDGNTLARHLVEECAVDGATLYPDPQVVAERQQREQQQQQQMQVDDQQYQAAYAAAGASEGAVYTTEGGDQQQPMPGAAIALGGAVEQQAVVLATAGTPLSSTYNITDASGELVQTLVLPEDFQLEPGQTLVLLHGEEGPQLAVINQSDLEVGPQQTEDDNSHLLLYGNVEGDVAEKENQL